MKPEERLALSARTIALWEQMGGLPSGKPEDTMRMIREEAQILHAMAAEHLELADEANAVARRYGALANRVRLGMN